jgi:cation transport ATPase
MRYDGMSYYSRRVRTIALQRAVGGMALSAIGTLFAATGSLPPVAGAFAQEIIDVVAVLNALRVGWSPRTLIDYGSRDSESPSV